MRFNQIQGYTIEEANKRKKRKAKPAPVITPGFGWPYWGGGWWNHHDEESDSDGGGADDGGGGGEA